MADSNRYTVFKRSCTSFRTMASARKITVERNLTATEAIRLCDSFNNDRTVAQIRRGTKMEFTAQ